MTTWAELEAAEPALAATITERFDAHKHKFLATVRADGSPRISGIETAVRGGELWLAGMPKGRKFADLRRDPRFALHSGSDDSDPNDPAAWTGDAKLSGIAIEVTDQDAIQEWAGEHDQPIPPGAFELFRVDIRDAVTIRVGDPSDHLVIDHWNHEHGLTSTKRY